ncbi:hypothetical protein MCC01950_03000 [Bifidobacteriaceae bacterium MCC01950]|nr:hypothetical protein MCC01950_03000 [Bifidobacteriaceae bacterium MCC01950]
MVFSGIFTRLAASMGSTRTRWESNASDGSTVAGSLAKVINVKSVTLIPLGDTARFCLNWRESRATPLSSARFSLFYAPVLDTDM